MDDHNDESWYDPGATTFGDRVAGARERAGMTQAELARRLGVKTKTLKAWEDDVREPRANRLSMMSGLLNVSLPWLLSGEGDGPAAPAGAGSRAEALAELRGLRRMLEGAADRIARLEKALAAEGGSE